MKAYIYFNSKSKGLDYNGEGPYMLMTEDNKCIGKHYCSSRGFANHDLTTWRMKELQENNISEVFSNGELVWKNNTMTDNAKKEFYVANADYESKYCNKIFIEHRDIDDQIETAKAALCLVGDWHRIAISQQSQHNEPTY